MLISNIYHKEILKQANRNAIGGKPRKILTTLKPTATTEEILKTLESNFGDNGAQRGTVALANYAGSSP